MGQLQTFSYLPFFEIPFAHVGFTLGSTNVLKKSLNAGLTIVFQTLVLIFRLVTARSPGVMTCVAIISIPKTLACHVK